jgi:hypothetical protein
VSVNDASVGVKAAQDLLGLLDVATQLMHQIFEQDLQIWLNRTKFLLASCVVLVIFQGVTGSTNLIPVVSYEIEENRSTGSGGGGIFYYDRVCLLQ